MAATMNEYEWEALPELETEYEGEEEYEFEGEFELEGEYEGEEEYEFEGEFELEGEYEGEEEYEYEGEEEAEEFIRRLANVARRAARSPALRRVGRAAARSAL